MKKLFYLLLIAVVPLFSQELSGPDIIKKVNDLMNQETVQSTVIMKITTSSGKKRTFEYLSYSKDEGEKNLIIYTLPNRVKGQKTLMLNNADDIWAYFARTKRVRKLASHAKKQKMEGSDFSYEDMGSNNAFINDFTTTRLDDEKKQGADCFKIQLIKKQEASSAYSKMIMWVSKENFLPLVIDYYNEDRPEVVEKILVQEDIVMIDNIATAKKIIMTNQNDQTNTILELKDIKYNAELDDEMFTERGLRK